MKHKTFVLLLILIFLICTGCVKEGKDTNQSVPEVPSIHDSGYISTDSEAIEIPSVPDLETVDASDITGPADTEQAVVDNSPDTEQAEHSTEEEDPEIEDNHVETIEEGQAVGGL